MTIQQVLELSKEYIIASYQNGISTAKLAKEFDCNSGSIYLFLKNHNIEVRKRPENYGLVEDRKDEILDLHSQGLSAYAISKKMKVAKCTILRYGRLWKLDFSINSKRKNPIFMKDQKDLIESMHLDGIPALKIGKQLGYSPSQISEFLNRMGYNQPLNKYDVDLNFFKQVDTEIKAYVLGFWYADGNVTKDKIRLQITDLDILERIKKEMSYTGNLLVSEPQKENYKTQYCLSIARSELVRDIMKLGCLPNKTLDNIFPSEKILPSQFVRHFIRGYIDGDGNIYYPRPKNAIRCQIVGTKEFLFGIERFANGVNSKCSWTQRFPERNKNNYNLIVSGNANCIRFLDKIYEDSTIHLERKFLTYKQYKEDN